jgi:signal transduction histidine kinase
LSTLLALAGLIVGWQAGGRAAESARAITSVREVRALGDDALKAGFPVRLRGVVLYRYVAGDGFYLQDESDAIYVYVYVDPSRTKGRPWELPAGLVPGAVAEIEGVALAGFSPFVRLYGNAGIHVVGTAPLPAPVPLTADAAQTGLLNAHLVTVEGVVRRTHPTPVDPDKVALEMVFEGTRLLVYLDREEGGLGDLVGARVRIQGISSGIWNKQRQIIAPCLKVTNQRDITVLQAAPSDPFALPVRSVADIMRYRPEDAPGHRIRIAGVVLHALADGRVFVLDGASAVCMECTSTPTVAMGDVVDAVGFPGVRERTPLLEDTVLRVRGHHAPLPAAMPCDAATILKQGKDYDVVQVEAVLLETQRTKSGTDLLVQSGDRIFKAAFDGAASGGILPRLKPGTSLSLSGMVLLSLPAQTTTKAFRPDGFSLLLRSPADVRIVRLPPWWTVERLLGISGTAIALVLVFALWNHFLRARAKVQREIISAQARREATSDERTRLARELHDTLEQEFVGMTRQTEALEHAGPLSPQAIENLDVLRQMLRHSRDNARRAVWDLRDPALLDCGLEVAIRHAVERIVCDQPAVVNFHAEITAPASIPPNVQVNVLRLAQEAVANVIKHSDAKTIEVVLRHRDGMVELAVTDDGHNGENGSAQAVAPAGHFGIIGMRERCEKLGGHFEFQSRAGGGASVRAQIPVPNDSQRSLI